MKREEVDKMLARDISYQWHKTLREKGINVSEIVEKAKTGVLPDNLHYYSNEIGNALADAYAKVLGPDVLPNETLYYNIVTSFLPENLAESYGMVSDIADAMQEFRNNAINIGLKSYRPKIDQDRVDGLVDAVSGRKYEEVAHYLDEPVKNFVDHVADKHLEENAKLLSNSGVKTMVVRVAESTACEWCQGLEGVYTYSNAPPDVWARHDGCRCSLEIRSERGRGYMKRSGRAFVRS